jgi:3-hydroxyacyl-CoA dehydrogenase/enoyl-CoA hydratase/3-hydroxybutyryl-CoA epimerase
MAVPIDRPNVRVERCDEQSAILFLDVADRPVNVFNRAVFADLESALDYLAAAAEIQLICVQSAKISKPIAGADLQEFTGMTTPEDARAMSDLGQRIFGKLAKLPAPTVIVIKGPCLGGGLEFALACDYRLLIDDPKTQLGLPEVELGIIPGWGGTQRLPRCIGIERALQVIVGGKRLSAREALQWGLVDEVAAGEPDFPDVLRRLGGTAAKHGKRPSDGRRLRGWRQRLLESNPVGRALLFRGSAQIMRRRIPDDMPAPAEALRAVRTGITRGIDAGLECERDANSRLMNTPACRNLLGLFFAREQARKPSADPPAKAAPIKRIAVVGAGTMGAGIAQLAAFKGLGVVVREVDASALASGKDRIRSLFDKAVERRLLPRAEADQKLEAIRFTTAWEGFAEVDLALEAIIEDLALKKEIFRQLEQHARPQTILATNTSSLLVAQLQEGLTHPERVAGIHFFNPVHKMPLVEVVHSATTSALAQAICTRLAVDLGKTPVTVKDSPGFVVNRILAPYIDEAVRLVSEGMTVDLIDQSMRRFGMPMGPLEMLDQVGLDVAAHVNRALGPLLGSRFPPDDRFAVFQARGWLGQKSGTGFYRYGGKKKKVNAEAATLLADRAAGGGRAFLGALPPAAQAHEARERMVLLMVNEATACLSEGLAADADAIDLAMVLGTGWAPHRGGPLHYLKDRGKPEVAAALSTLARRLGQRFEPHSSLLTQPLQHTSPAGESS